MVVKVFSRAPSSFMKNMTKITPENLSGPELALSGQESLPVNYDLGGEPGSRCFKTVDGSNLSSKEGRRRRRGWLECFAFAEKRLDYLLNDAFLSS